MDIKSVNMVYTQDWALVKDITKNYGFNDRYAKRVVLPITKIEGIKQSITIFSQRCLLLWSY